MRHVVLAALMAFGLFAVQACQVKPLYSSRSGAESKLVSVGVDPVDTRVEQEMRNQLIFLYSGGKGEPAKPDYTLNFSLHGVASSVLREQLTNGITAQRYTATVTFTLRDNETKLIVDSGKRSIVTFYDQTTQEFANRRALRDAENRAARELAEIVRADTASILTR